MKKTCIITIGSFDGVHRGHQALLKRTSQEARIRKVKSMALTFNIPPRGVLSHEKAPFILSTPLEKEWLIKNYGIDQVRFFEFNQRISKLKPFQFFKKILLQKYNSCGIVIGHDFRFGANRAGGAVDLVRWGVEYGIPIWVIGPVSNLNQTISSTHIRQLLNRGKYTEAQRLMNHPYRIAEKIIRGRGMGKKIGFPTINLKTNPRKIYPRGVFVIQGKVSNKSGNFGGVCNIGVRPTISSKGGVSVEIHILGRRIPRTGQNVHINLLKALRSEKKFGSLEALKSAIQRDISKTRQYFNKKA